PVEFDVGNDIQCVPDVMHLGARDVGAEVREVVAVRSLSGQPFRVKEARAEGEGLKVVRLEAGNTVNYEITQRVARPGPIQNRVVLVVEPQAGRTLEIPIPVNVSGHAR